MNNIFKVESLTIVISFFFFLQDRREEMKKKKKEDDAHDLYGKYICICIHNTLHIIIYMFIYPRLNISCHAIHRNEEVLYILLLNIYYIWLARPWTRKILLR